MAGIGTLESVRRPRYCFEQVFDVQGPVGQL